MKALPKPLQDKEVKDIFTECVSNFTSEKARRSKMRHISEVERCARDYDKYIPGDMEHFVHPKLSSEETEDLKKVYQQKFVPLGAVGRKYYDAIMAQAKGICPICRAAATDNLDHYLPQSKYALLVVTPANLVPSCWHCNMEKHSYDTAKSSEMPLHPYFDKIDLQWLEAKITFQADGTFSIEYGNGINEADNPFEKVRIDKHIKVHDLNKTFSSMALIEMDSVKSKYKKMLGELLEEGIQKDLEEVCESAEAYDVNSWKAALYRALIRQKDEYIEWLPQS